MGASLNAAVHVLRAGGIVLHPTEAVWGLACDPFQASAVAGVFALKQRSPDKGVILVADRFGRFARLLKPVPGDCLRVALASWPGPHTWVWPALASAPEWLVGERGTLALRVSAHPQVAALCELFGGALVSTSANTSGHPAPATLSQVEPVIRAGVGIVIDGQTGGRQRPTTIRDVLTGDVLRD